MKTMSRWKLSSRIAVWSLLINFIIECLGRHSVVKALVYALGSPLVFLYNSLLIGITFSVVYLTKRKVFALSVVAAAWLGMGFVNFVLLSFRVTPFTAADFQLIKYGINVMPIYMSWYQIVLLVIGAAAVAAGVIILWRKGPKDSEKIRYPMRIGVIAVLFAVFMGITQLGIWTNMLSTNFGNIAFAYQDYGFPYCFSNSLLNVGINKPDDYAPEVVEVIEKEDIIQEETKPEELTEKELPDIIFVQLESFYDPMAVKGLSLSQDPIPNFRRLSKEYSTGYLSVPSVGAGTANTEFEVISGMNLDFFGPGEYPYKTVLQKEVCESISFDLKDIGYGAHAIHNNEGTFYDRHKVFSQLGFDTFTPIEYMYDAERNPTGWVKDKILVGEIMKSLDSTEGSDFVYAISVQGHGAYPSDKVIENPKIQVTEYLTPAEDGTGEAEPAEEAVVNAWEYYCNEINEMDQFIGELIEALDNRGKDCVLVMYGDHLPTMGLEETDLLAGNLFQTRYVMWNNMGLAKQDRDVEAYQLTAQVLAQLDIHVGTMIRYHQKFLKEKNGDADAYLENMKVLEYDMLYGDREIYGGTVPYEPTKLRMGTMPITIDKVLYSGGIMRVYGKNFNEYSKLFIDGREMETEYVSSRLITYEDEDFDPEEHILTVQQVGRDTVALGGTEEFLWQAPTPETRAPKPATASDAAEHSNDREAFGYPY